jgi:hypothetical protein
MLVISWPHDDGAELFTWAKLRRIDFLGGISIFTATGFLVFGIQQGGSGIYLWSKNEVSVAFALAGLSWVIFATWQLVLGLTHFPKIEPVFPVRLIFRRVYVGAFM